VELAIPIMHWNRELRMSVTIGGEKKYLKAGEVTQGRKDAK